MAKYLDIKFFDDANTDDYAVGIWFSKCSHHCVGCQNKESWKDIGEEFTEDTLEMILTHFEENQSFYGNLFLTGGDPLHKDNIETSIYIAKRFKEKFGNKFPIWVWTGYTFSEIKDIEILNYIDVLIDGKYIEELRDVQLLYRGSKNQMVYRKKNNVWQEGKVSYNQQV